MAALPTVKPLFIVKSCSTYLVVFLIFGVLRMTEPTDPSQIKEDPDVVNVGEALIVTGSTIPQRPAVVALSITPRKGGSRYT